MRQLTHFVDEVSSSMNLNLWLLLQLQLLIKINSSQFVVVTILSLTSLLVLFWLLLPYLIEVKIKL